ncbi:hypothetical protein RA280_38920 [Cupriavidus sp. CV2]|uniref:hypothetical protein n=1 Tax=Cupriavidus ulmosensis TaxID=3065913 RepID=UPI00296A9E36|nr:hypothetical protein [Cupriavidus sp. CV2]MDW3687606.1 hypothetical protein [Cupriavidus sp. CV2]
MTDFIVQKLLSALQPGQRLMLGGSNVPVHTCQGQFDGGCTIHAAAAALALLGCLSDPGRLSSRRRGPEAEFWRRASPFYLSGMTLSELANLIWELNWGLRPTVFEGAHHKVLDFCESKLSRGGLVILSWRQVNRSHLHAVLAIGLEGPMRARKFEPRTMLLLDPSEHEPWLSTCNARLNYAGPDFGRRPRRATYITAGEPRKDVVLDGAVSIRLAAATNVLRKRA